MKKLITLIFTALVILAMPAASAFAAGKDMDSASLIESGKTYKGNTEEARWYKIDTEKGTLKITAQLTKECSYPTYFQLFDKNGAEVYPNDTKVSVGSLDNDNSFALRTSSDSGKANAYATFSVKKGTYYIKVYTWRNFLVSEVTNFKFKVTTPGTANNSSNAKLVGFSTAMKAGETLTMNPLTSASGAKVTWSTSDKSVATVSGGKITAVKAGTADITCKCGNSSITIRVKVS